MSKQNRFHGRMDNPAPPPCDHPGCEQPGEFRAPKPGTASGGEGFYLFCLDHVRAYNEQWDYFKGMSRAQVEAAAWAAYTWERPTFTRNSQTGPLPDLEDVMGLFDDLSDFGRKFASEGKTGPHGRRLTQADIDALATLGLDEAADTHAIRNAYRRLVRAYHPDLNGGARHNETKLAAVIAAYKQLHRSSTTA